MSIQEFLQSIGASLLAVVLVTNGVQAQTVYGLQQGVIPWQEGLYLSGYDVMSNTWVYGDTLEYAEGFALGTSTYDQWNDAYVFLGAPAGGGPLAWMSQTLNESAMLATLSGNLHSMHHDMQNGQFYGLEGYALDSVFVDLGEGLGYWNIVEWGTRLLEIEVVNNFVERTTVVEMPWLQGVVAGASCFDSDLHRFFIWGINADGEGRLITVDCLEAEILSNVAVNAGANANLSEFEYNIEDSTLIGLRSIVDANGDAAMDLITVDPMTGAYAPALDLPNVGSYTPDGTVFDQLNGRYIMHYYEGLGLNSRIMAVDAATWEVVADHALETNFLELEMRNVNFAAFRYGSAQIVSPVALSVYLKDGQWFNGSEKRLLAMQFDLAGRQMATLWLEPGESYPVGSGHWLWTFVSDSGMRATRHTFRP